MTAPIYRPRNVIVFAIMTTTLLALTGCHSVPVTGRKQVVLMSADEEVQMGAQAFVETVSEERPSQNPQYVAMVNRVGQRLAAVAARPDFDWEFRVIQSPQQNAFCLPGGKVAVYEGILPICQTETGLAVVMAHEVAHALARHGAERVSHGYVVDGLGKMVDVVAQRHATSSDAVQKIAQGYGIASNYGFVLPYSRKHESEADEIGIILMAKAGYDPAEAPRFWQRFAQVKTGGQTPEFMSTHPSDERRESDLQQQLARASEIYAQAPQKFGMGEQIVFTAPQTTVATQPALASTRTSGSPPTGSQAPAMALSEETHAHLTPLRTAHQQPQSIQRQQQPAPPSSRVIQASAIAPVRRPEPKQFGQNPLR